MHSLGKILRLLAALLVAASVPFSSLVAAEADPVVVIVHKDNQQQLDVRFVAAVYTGRLKGWPDGSPVFPLDQDENSPAREIFFRQFVGKSVATMRAVWAQNIFSGKGLPPKIANPGPEMRRIVGNNRNAIGYIRLSEVDDSVRVLLR
jgi:ABC-type phosphate transport system substrate-binding protein